MADSNYPFHAIKNLFEKSAMIRAEAIRTQIGSVYTFCDWAEFQLKGQSLDEAQRTMSKVHNAMSKISFHLQEPGHVVPEAMGELQDIFAKAKVRVQQTENALSPQKSRVIGNPEVSPG